VNAVSFFDPRISLRLRISHQFGHKGGDGAKPFVCFEFCARCAAKIEKDNEMSGSLIKVVLDE
jgi:hypothetical protein